MKKFFILVSVFGFLFPYILKFLLNTQDAQIKVFCIYALNKFNLIYFFILILLFFLGIWKKSKLIQILQISFVFTYISYIFLDFFIFSKIKAQNFIKTHKLDAKIEKIANLKNYPNFKIYYKSGAYAVIKPLKENKKTLPFNYKKDRY